MLAEDPIVRLQRLAALQRGQALPDPVDYEAALAKVAADNGRRWDRFTRWTVVAMVAIVVLVLVLSSCSVKGVHRWDGSGTVASHEWDDEDRWYEDGDTCTLKIDDVCYQYNQVEHVDPEHFYLFVRPDGFGPDHRITVDALAYYRCNIGHRIVQKRCPG